MSHVCGQTVGISRRWCVLWLQGGGAPGGLGSWIPWHPFWRGFSRLQLLYGLGPRGTETPILLARRPAAHSSEGQPWQLVLLHVFHCAQWSWYLFKKIHARLLLLLAREMRAQSLDMVAGWSDPDYNKSVLQKTSIEHRNVAFHVPKNTIFESYFGTLHNNFQWHSWQCSEWSNHHIRINHAYLCILTGALAVFTPPSFGMHHGKVDDTICLYRFCLKTSTLILVEWHRFCFYTQQGHMVMIGEQAGGWQWSPLSAVYPRSETWTSTAHLFWLWQRCLRRKWSWPAAWDDWSWQKWRPAPLHPKAAPKHFGPPADMLMSSSLPALWHQTLWNFNCWIIFLLHESCYYFEVGYMPCAMICILSFRKGR